MPRALRSGLTLASLFLIATATAPRLKAQDFPKYKVKTLQKAADAADGQAAFELGEFYQVNTRSHTNPITLMTVHDKANLTKSSQWLRKAEQLAYVNPYREEKVSQAFLLNKKWAQEGVYWLEKAATHGNADAAYRLKNLYTSSEIMPRDASKAGYWTAQATRLSPDWTIRRPVLAEQESQRAALEQAKDDEIAQDHARRHEENMALFSEVASSINESLTPKPVYYPPAPSTTTSSSDTSNSSNGSSSKPGASSSCNAVPPATCRAKYPSYGN